MKFASNPSRRGKAWMIWLCLVLFVGTCFAETVHVHSTATADLHCTLCLAAHSVARPASAVNPVAAPRHCVAVLALGAISVPDSLPVPSLDIRPPPAA